jgi:hypothetical protein
MKPFEDKGAVNIEKENSSSIIVPSNTDENQNLPISPPSGADN